MKINIANLLARKRPNPSTVLAGDIGGTKTSLGYFLLKDDILDPQEIFNFASQNYPDFESILKEFMMDHPHADLQGACFGIAGPVMKGICRTTNLPWVVDTSALKSILRIEPVELINDMEATAYGIQALPETSFSVLNPGTSELEGNIAVIAAGTGLGEGMLLWDGERYRAITSEGGHADFAPGNILELELCRYLLDKFGHCSYERVLSGPGLLNVYNFLKEKNPGEESSFLKKELAKNDPGTVISQNGLAGRDALCVKTLDIFCAVYGAEAGNLALKVLARGGVYLGGGIAPKIISKLQEDGFRKAFLDKGRLSGLMSRIPVHVILEENAALYGAAIHALQVIAGNFEHVDQR